MTEKRHSAVMSIPVVLLALLLCGCSSGSEKDLAQRLGELEAGSSLVDSSRVDGYERDIKALEKEVDQIISNVQEKGTLYELLALKYMDYQMYGPALESLTRAIEIYPEKATLYYYRGLACGVLAQSSDLPDVRNQYLQRAETNYRRSTAVDNRYSPPLYALAILVIYEYQEPLKAASLLDHYLEIERSDPRAMLLRAQVYELEGDKTKALEVYRSIINTAGDESYKSAAEQKIGELK